MFQSGLPDLDHCLGSGAGVPPGSILMIDGPSDSGKTALALWYCRTFQHAHPDVVGWVQVESLLTWENLTWAGIDADRMVVADRSPLLPGLEAAREMVDNGCPLVVVDSLAALVGENEDAYLTKVLGEGMPPLKRSVEVNQALVILTNQQRRLPMSRQIYTAGACPVLAATVGYRIRIHQGEGVYRGGNLLGMRIHFKVTKNGSDPRTWGGEGRFNLSYRRGLVAMRR